MIDEFILNALKEDMPNGDITTDHLIDASKKSEARLIAKEEGIISGIEIANRVFSLVDSEIEMNIFFHSGDEVHVGDVIAKITGKTTSILKGERVALNIMQRMSGVATTTKQYVNKLVGNTKILDTRKTTPNMRYFEKLAVTHGGGTNHRYSLSDMVMIKDNHINAAGSITNAVKKIKPKVNVKIEVEVENIMMFEEALSTDCDIIMLDNMSNEDMLVCVKKNNGKKLLEASGNMSLERISEVSALGVDFISVGALTHSYKSLDISLKFI